MKTIAEVQADRAAAGAAYAAAAQAYVDTYVELHAHDLAITSAAVCGPNAITGGGFPALHAPTPHSEFLRESLHGNANDRAKTRLREIVASLEA